MKHGRAAALSALVAALLCGCQTPAPSAPEPGPRLPLHVGIVVLDAEDIVVDHASADAAGDETEMAVQIDAAELHAELVAALDEIAFARVTELYGSTDEVVLERARNEGVDLVLDWSARHGATLTRERVLSPTRNVLLFALGGPFAAYDRDYAFHANARIEGALFDPHVADGSRVELMDDAALVAPVDAGFPGRRLNFLERAPGTTPLVAALVMPTGWLATESDAIAERVNDYVTRDLARAFATSLTLERDTILVRPETSAFLFDPDALVVERESGDRIRVEGEVLVPPGSIVERMRRWELAAGTGTVGGAFEAGTSDANGDVYRFEATLIAPNARYLELSLEGGVRDPIVRSYTWDLERLP